MSVADSMALVMSYITAARQTPTAAIHLNITSSILSMVLLMYLAHMPRDNMAFFHLYINYIIIPTLIILEPN